MTLSRNVRTPLAILSCAALALVWVSVPTAHAAASLYVTAAGSATTGQNITITIKVDTGGVSANSFQGNITYPADLFDGVRGSYAGSVCTLPIVQPDPSGGTASFSCGKPGGFTGTGTVATIVLLAKTAGEGNISLLSGCKVLANDGKGTSLMSSCTGSGISVVGATIGTDTTPTPSAQPTYNATPTPTPKAGVTPKTSPTPKAGVTPKATPTPDTRTDVAVEQAKNVTPPPDPGAPPVQSLAPLQEVATPTPEDTSTQQRRTIAQALQDILRSAKDMGSLKGNTSSLIALMVTTIPFLAILLAILFLVYRLYMLERRRRRTIDRLFEMELSELAALEGKLDLLSEKGTKGRDVYREEFRKVKENILRQLKPDFAKPIEPERKAKEAPVASDTPPSTEKP